MKRLLSATLMLCGSFSTCLAVTCTASVVDCDGVTISCTWDCPKCNPPNSIRGTCKSAHVLQDPNDPKSCVVGLSGAQRNVHRMPSAMRNLPCDAKLLS